MFKQREVFLAIYVFTILTTSVLAEVGTYGAFIGAFKHPGKKITILY